MSGKSDNLLEEIRQVVAGEMRHAVTKEDVRLVVTEEVRLVVAQEVHAIVESEVRPIVASEIRPIAASLTSLARQVDRIEVRLVDAETQLGEVKKQTDLIPGMAEALHAYGTDIDHHERRIKRFESKVS